MNDRLQTTAPNVWAIGECAGSPQFTHISLDDFRVIRDNLAVLHPERYAEGGPWKDLRGTQWSG